MYTDGQSEKVNRPLTGLISVNEKEVGYIKRLILVL